MKASEPSTSKASGSNRAFSLPLDQSIQLSSKFLRTSKSRQTSLPQSPEIVLQQVAKKIVPSDQEQEKMIGLSQTIQREVEYVLASAGIQAKVSPQGSFARDTWLSGEADLDIFARFPSTMEREEWVEKVLPTMHKYFSRYRVLERYAEHPFLEFRVDGVRVNIVPSYDVKKGEWKSATDRTPYHTDFMQTHLTSELRREARLLKKFAKGIGTNGAEIKIGGFSGMLIDTLVLYYQSFMETLRRASSWNKGTLLEIGKPEGIVREEFKPDGSAHGSDEMEESAILVEADRTTLSAVRRQKGPPVSKSEDSVSFLEKHLSSNDTVRGPWIEGDRWMVEKKRGISSIRDLVKAATREESYALSIPKQLGESFGKSVKVLQNREILSMLAKKGFDKSL